VELKTFLKPVNKRRNLQKKKNRKCGLEKWKKIWF